MALQGKSRWGKVGTDNVKIERSNKMIYKPKKKYSWNYNFGAKVSADVVGATFERLEEEQGEVNKENFLEASRPEESATHNLFEWNDSIAAEKYRLQQSGKYIQLLNVTIVNIPQQAQRQEVSIASDELKPKPMPITTRAYVDTAPGRCTKGAFVNIETALSDDEKRKIVLAHAFDELQMFEKKYELYGELSGVFTAIDKFGRELKDGT